MNVSIRRAIIIAAHVALWAAALGTAVLLRFDFKCPRSMDGLFGIWLPLLLIMRLAVFYGYGLFRGIWRYTGARDGIQIAKATTLSTLAFLAFLVMTLRGFPRSIVAIEWFTALVFVGGARLAARALRPRSFGPVLDETPSQRVLIVGAGDAAEMLLRELQRSHAHRYTIVGLVDDARAKQGALIHGVRVCGRVEDIPSAVEKHDVTEVIIAIPSATGAQMRRIIELCKAAAVHFKTIPGVDHLIDGRVAISQLRDVAIEDLLRRDPVQLDMAVISASMRDHVVMVTGAGGSIGSEICRQVCRFSPSSLVLVERAENNLFNIHRELVANEPGVTLVPCLADVGDAQRMRELFARHRPTIVFHAAAHKHVPMMEWNPGEAVKNNVLGTRTVADLADEFDAERFVMISTDKAVNPTSVMGVSKRVAEIYVQALSQRSRTRFVTVRFGNVLGSAGSAIPIFKEQIARGGPVTVTHPDMKRYFMTIPEASQLVLQAGAMGDGGEIFILDMGEPIKIADLARDLIRLSGFTPGVDIGIDFTGIRPGEKLYEELSVDAENADKTRHPKIFVGRFRPYEWEEVVRFIADVEKRVDRPDDLRRKLKEMVPEYHRPAHDPAAASQPERAASVVEFPAARVAARR